MCLDHCVDTCEPLRSVWEVLNRQGCDGASDHVVWKTKAPCEFTVKTHLVSSLCLEKWASSCILSDIEDTTSKKDNDVVAPGMGEGTVESSRAQEEIRPEVSTQSLGS